MTVVSVAAACVEAEIVSVVSCCACPPEEEPPQAVIAVESTSAAVRTQRLLVRIRVLLCYFRILVTSEISIMTFYSIVIKFAIVA
jgi:hypothetical protein